MADIDEHEPHFPVPAKPGPSSLRPPAEDPGAATAIAAPTEAPVEEPAKEPPAKEPPADPPAKEPEKTPAEAPPAKEPEPVPAPSPVEEPGEAPPAKVDAEAMEPEAEATKEVTATPVTAAGVPLVRGRWAEVGAILSGLLYFVSFAGFDVWPLTFVALVPLYLSLFGQTPRRATWLGFLTGLAMNLGGFYWLINMLKTFSGFPLPLCLLFTVIICSYQGGRFALMGWLHGRATARGWPAPIVFGAALVASELVYPLLFPWYYAATIHNVPVLMQLSEVGGPILVGLVLLAVNLAIAEPLRARLAASRDVRARTLVSGANEERVSLALDRRIIGTGVIAMIGALLYGAVRLSMVHARIEKSEEAKVGFVQGNMSLTGKRENPSEGLRRHREKTAELKAKGADFVVWSETSATFPTSEESAEKGHFFRDKFAASLGIPAIFGGILYRRNPDPKLERWFNTAIATDANGEIRGRYDKQYLLAFGEYLPFGDTFPILYQWSPHSGRFSSGSSFEPVIIDVKGVEHRVSVLICYEDILPGFTNKAVSHADPDLIVNMTNDAWFGDTLEPWQHLALAKFRAVEHRRYLVRSTNSGVSAVIDPTGRTVDGTVTTPFTIDARLAPIRWMRGRTVYEVIGDVPWYLVTLGIVAAAFRRRRAPVAV